MAQITIDHIEAEDTDRFRLLCGNNTSRFVHQRQLAQHAHPFIATPQQHFFSVISPVWMGQSLLLPRSQPRGSSEDPERGLKGSHDRGNLCHTPAQCKSVCTSPTHRRPLHPR